MSDAQRRPPRQPAAEHDRRSPHGATGAAGGATGGAVGTGAAGGTGTAGGAGCTLDGLLATADRIDVYRARLEPAGGSPKPILVKLLRAETPAAEEIARFDAERETIRSLKVDGVPRLASTEKVLCGRPAIALEAVPGEQLRGFIVGRPISLGRFLSIAIEMTAIVGRLHAAGVTHKDLTPDHFLWDEQDARLTLIDLGRATRLSRERLTPSNQEMIDGRPAYVSPEQTGRMNRPLDFRTDFYSLGICFFEMLTGRVPFESDDPLEIVHGHIARRPPRVETLNTDAPVAVGNIVARLLEKSAQDRYQSATGLQADLERCRRQLAESHRVEPFELGQDDASAVLRVPGKLYGRDREVETLLAAFERIREGGTDFVLVAGYSGIGKTSLVGEIHRPIATRGGHFVEGRFDPLGRNIPYSAWIGAFTSLAHHLLMEGQAELDAWRARLAGALGTNGKVVTDVIPDLRLVVGSQPEVPDLGPSEMQNCFQRVFGDFVRALATPERPLAVFLDALQWADQASLALLESLLADPELADVLIVGAYRDNELDPGHLLTQSLLRIRKSGRKVTTIKVGSLRVADVAHLLADTLHCPVEHADELARLVHAKTDGNPLFIGGLLEAMLDSGLPVRRRLAVGSRAHPPGSDRRRHRRPDGRPDRPAAGGHDGGPEDGGLHRRRVRPRRGGAGARPVRGRDDRRPGTGLRGRPGRGLGQDRPVHPRQGQRGDLRPHLRRGARGHPPCRWPNAARGGRRCLARGSGLPGCPTVQRFRLRPDGRRRPIAFQANLQAGRRAGASAAFEAASASTPGPPKLLPENAWEADYATTLALHI